MKVSFCQTYGNDRKELLEIKFRDKQLLNFLSFFDVNIFSFHNCSNELINWFKAKNNIPNLKLFINNNITYTECIKRLLITLKELNAKYLFFNQDDTFSFENDTVDLSKLLTFVFNEPDIVLNLYADTKLLAEKKLYKDLETIEIHYCDTFTFAKKTWSFDDSPYICTTNYLPIIYDENYLSKDDIWTAEHYLNFKFQTYNLKRYITNYSLFKNYNFLGPNNWNHDNEIVTLKNKKLL